MSFVPIMSGSSATENGVPEPLRSGRVKTSTQGFDPMPQPGSSATGSSMKRKRSEATHNDQSDQRKSVQTTYAQAGAATSKTKAAAKRVANHKPISSDQANAKPTTKSRPLQPTGNVIDLTGDDEASPSKKPRRSKSGKGEEKRLKA